MRMESNFTRHRKIIWILCILVLIVITGCKEKTAEIVEEAEKSVKGIGCADVLDEQKRSNCYTVLAAKELNPSHCNKILNEINRQSCYSGVCSILYEEDMEKYEECIEGNLQS